VVDIQSQRNDLLMKKGGEDSCYLPCPWFASSQLKKTYRRLYIFRYYLQLYREYVLVPAQTFSIVRASGFLCLPHNIKRNEELCYEYDVSVSGYVHSCDMLSIPLSGILHGQTSVKMHDFFAEVSPDLLQRFPIGSEVLHRYMGQWCQIRDT